VIDGIVTYMRTVHDAAGDANTGLQAIVDGTGEGALVGKTGDWLRNQISGKTRDFLSMVTTAFAAAEPAMSSYVTKLREAQASADSALSQAAGMSHDDARWASLVQQAKDAGTDAHTAASTAAGLIDTVASAHSPWAKSACEEFWEIFQWIVLVISVIAIFVGGPLGLLAFGLNAVLAVKSIVDFAEGKIGIGGLILGLLGIIAPSTRAISLGSLLKTLGGAVKTILSKTPGLISKLGSDAWQFVKSFSLSSVIRGVVDISHVLAGSIKAGAIFVVKGISGAGLAVKDFVVLHGFSLTAFSKALGNGVTTAVKSLGTAISKGWADSGIGKVLSAELGGWKALRIFTPLHAGEIGTLGVGGAFKVGVLGRGLLIPGFKGEANLVGKIGAGVQITDGGLRVGGVGSHGAGDTFRAPGLHLPTGAENVTLGNISGIGRGTGDLHFSNPTGNSSFSSISMSGDGWSFHRITEVHVDAGSGVGLTGNSLSHSFGITPMGDVGHLGSTGAGHISSLPGGMTSGLHGLDSVSGIGGATGGLHGLSELQGLNGGLRGLNGGSSLHGFGAGSMDLSGLSARSSIAHGVDAVSPQGGIHFSGDLSDAVVSSHLANKHDLSDFFSPEVKKAINGEGITVLGRTDNNISINLAPPEHLLSSTPPPSVGSVAGRADGPLAQLSGADAQGGTAIRDLPSSGPVKTGDAGPHTLDPQARLNKAMDLLAEPSPGHVSGPPPVRAGADGVGHTPPREAGFGSADAHAAELKPVDSVSARSSSPEQAASAHRFDLAGAKNTLDHAADEAAGNLRAADVTGADLAGAHLSGIDSAGGHLTGAERLVVGGDSMPIALTHDGQFVDGHLGDGVTGPKPDGPTPPPGGGDHGTPIGSTRSASTEATSLEHISDPAWKAGQHDAVRTYEAANLHLHEAQSAMAHALNPHEAGLVPDAMKLTVAQKDLLVAGAVLRKAGADLEKVGLTAAGVDRRIADLAVANQRWTSAKAELQSTYSERLAEAAESERVAGHDLVNGGGELDPRTALGLDHSQWRALDRSRAQYDLRPNAANQAVLDHTLSVLGVDPAKLAALDRARELGPSPSQIAALNTERAGHGLGAMSDERARALLTEDADDVALRSAIATDSGYAGARDAFEFQWLQHAHPDGALSAEAGQALDRLSWARWSADPAREGTGPVGLTGDLRGGFTKAGEAAPGQLSDEGLSRVWTRYVDSIRAGGRDIMETAERGDLAWKMDELFANTAGQLDHAFSAELRFEQELGPALKSFDQVVDEAKMAGGPWASKLTPEVVDRARVAFTNDLRSGYNQTLRELDITPGHSIPKSVLDKLVGRGDLGEFLAQRAELGLPKLGTHLEDFADPAVIRALDRQGGFSTWDAKVGNVLDGVPDRLRFEAGANAALDGGGRSFDELAKGFDLASGRVDAIAADFREDLAIAYHDSHEASGSVRGWMDHELGHENSFGAGRSAEAEPARMSQQEWRNRLMQMFAGGEDSAASSVKAVDSVPVPSVRADSVPSAAAHGEPVHGEPVHGEPVHADLVHEQPVHQQPVHQPPVRRQPMHEPLPHSESAAPKPLTKSAAALETKLTTVFGADAASAADCLVRLGQLHDALYPVQAGAARAAATVDTALTPVPALAQKLGAQTWDRVGSSWTPVEDAVRNGEHGTTGFVYAKPPGRPQHAFAAMNWHGEVHWTELQNAGGERVLSQAPAVPVGGRAIVLGPDGVVLPLHGAFSGGLAGADSTRTVDALLDPPTTSTPGMHQQLAAETSAAGAARSATETHLETEYHNPQLESSGPHSVGVDRRFFEVKQPDPAALETAAPRRQISAEQVAQYRKIQEAVVQVEKDHSQSDYAFYHAQDPRMRIAQDVYKKVFERTHPEIQVPEDFHFLRYPGPDDADFKAYQDVEQFFLEDMKKNGLIDDNLSHTKTHIISANVALHGGLNHAGEETFHYFQIGKGQTEIPVAAFVKGFLDKFGLESGGADQLYADAMKLNDTSEGSLIQILLPKDKADAIAYLAHPHGLPHDDELLKDLHTLGSVKYDRPRAGVPDREDGLKPPSQVEREKMNDEITRKLDDVRKVWNAEHPPAPQNLVPPGTVSAQQLAALRPQLDAAETARQESRLADQAHDLHDRTVERFQQGEYKPSKLLEEYVNQPESLAHPDLARQQALQRGSYGNPGLAFRDRPLPDQAELETQLDRIDLEPVSQGNAEHYSGQGLLSKHEMLRVANRANYMQARVLLSEAHMLNPASGVRMIRYTTMTDANKAAYNQLIDDYVEKLFTVRENQNQLKAAVAGQFDGAKLSEVLTAPGNAAKLESALSFDAVSHLLDDAQARPIVQTLSGGKSGLMKDAYQVTIARAGDGTGLSVKVETTSSSVLRDTFGGKAIPLSMNRSILAQDVLRIEDGVVRPPAPAQPAGGSRLVSSLLDPSLSGETHGASRLGETGDAARVGEIGDAARLGETGRTAVDPALEAKLGQLFGTGPSELPDCVLRAETVARSLARENDYPVGRAATMDDVGATSGRLSDLSRTLGAGADGFTPLGSVDRNLTGLAEQLRGMDDDSVAYVAAAPPNAPKHIALLWKRADGPVWVELQDGAGMRVRALDDPPLMPVDAKVIIKTADGRIVPPSTELSGGGRTVEAMADPATTAHTGMYQPVEANEVQVAEASTSQVLDPIPTRPSEYQPYVITHAGYATGDQFSVLSTLLHDEHAHVVVTKGPRLETDASKALEPTDKGVEIAEFYRSAGIDSSRIHEVPVSNLRDQSEADKLAVSNQVNHLLQQTWRAPEGVDRLPNKALDLGLDDATKYVAKHFNDTMRQEFRHALQLDELGDRSAPLQQWLESKNITVGPDTEVTVLWSRFSGKKGDVHVEHDTSLEGMRQILNKFQEESLAKPELKRLVVIAGDRHPDRLAAGNMPAKSYATTYSEMAKDFSSGENLKIADLTEFWKASPGPERESLAAWKGDTRIGQYAAYEYLKVNSKSLQHIGFRSGNLEAFALSGHVVRYLEEANSIGGARMAAWHETPPGSTVTVDGGQAPGYERLLLDQPPTRSGKHFKVEFGLQEANAKLAQGQLTAFRKVNSALKDPKELNSLSSLLTKQPARAQVPGLKQVTALETKLTALGNSLDALATRFSATRLSATRLSVARDELASIRADLDPDQVGTLDQVRADAINEKLAQLRLTLGPARLSEDELKALQGQVEALKPENRPDWASVSTRSEKPAAIRGYDKGFQESDLNKISEFLFREPPRSEPAPAPEPLVAKESLVAEEPLTVDEPPVVETAVLKTETPVLDALANPAVQARLHGQVIQSVSEQLGRAGHLDGTSVSSVMRQNRALLDAAFSPERLSDLVRDPEATTLSAVIKPDKSFLIKRTLTVEVSRTSEAGQLEVRVQIDGTAQVRHRRGGDLIPVMQRLGQTSHSSATVLLDSALSIGTRGRRAAASAAPVLDPALDSRLTQLFGTGVSELPDCVVRAEAVARSLARENHYPVGRAATTDDVGATSGRLSDLALTLGAGADGFRSLGSVDRTMSDLVEQLRGMDDDSVAYVASAAPNAPKHVALLWKRADGPVWVELQDGAGMRVRTLDDPPLMPVDAKVIIKTADGRIVEPVTAGPGVRELADPASTSGTGMLFKKAPAPERSATQTHLDTVYHDPALDEIGPHSQGVDRRFFTQTRQPTPEELVNPVPRRQISAEQVEQYREIQKAVIANEKASSATDYAFYHAQDPRMRIAQDVYKRVYAKYHGVAIGEDFHFLRYPGPGEKEFSQYPDVQDFFTKDMDAHGLIDDNLFETKSHIISANVALHGGLNHAGEETFHYFQIGKGQTEIPVARFVREFLDKFKLESAGAEDLYAEAMKLNDTSEGSLIQILLPKESADQIAYLAHPHGLPHDDELLKDLHTLGSVRYDRPRAGVADREDGLKPPSQVEREKMNDEITRKLDDVRKVWNAEHTGWQEARLADQARDLHDRTLQRFGKGEYAPSKHLEAYVSDPDSLAHPDLEKQKALIERNPEHYSGQGLLSKHEMLRVANRANYLQARVLLSESHMLNPASGVRMIRYTTMTDANKAAYNTLLDDFVDRLFAGLDHQADQVRAGIEAQFAKVDLASVLQAPGNAATLDSALSPGAIARLLDDPHAAPIVTEVTGGKSFLTKDSLRITVSRAAEGQGVSVQIETVRTPKLRASRGGKAVPVSGEPALVARDTVTIQKLEAAPAAPARTSVDSLTDPPNSVGTHGRITAGRSAATAEATVDQELETRLGDLFGAGPSELPDCVVRAEAVARSLAREHHYPMGRAATTDDVGASSASLSELARTLGATEFRSLGSVDRRLSDLVVQLDELPEDSVAYVATAAPNAPKHVALLWKRADGPVWVELQDGAGFRVRALDDPPVMPVDAKVLIKAADGQLIEPVGAVPAPSRAVDAVSDPASTSTTGMLQAHSTSAAGQLTGVSTSSLTTPGIQAELTALEQRLAAIAETGAKDSVPARNARIQALRADLTALRSTQSASQQLRMTMMKPQFEALERQIAAEQSVVDARVQTLQKYLKDDDAPYNQMIESGRFWTDPVWERPLAKTESYLDSLMPGQARGRRYVEKLSAANLARMRTENQRYQGEWVGELRGKLTEALQSSVLSHYTTPDRSTEMITSGMRSKSSLELETPEFQHNTSIFDEHGLANSGFVFFFIESPQAPLRSTRFAEPPPGASAEVIAQAAEVGKARVTLGLQESGLLSKGWVMLTDFAQREFPTLMADADRPEVVESFLPTRAADRKHPEYQQPVRAFVKDRGIGFEQSDLEEMQKLADPEARQVFSTVRAVTLGDGRHAMTYGTGPNRVAYAETLGANVLHGKDIVPGLVERAVLEVGRIERVNPALALRLQGLSGPELMKFLLKDLLRPQAMLPRRVPIRADQVQIEAPAPAAAAAAPAAPVEAQATSSLAALLDPPTTSGTHGRLQVQGTSRAQNRAQARPPARTVNQQEADIRRMPDREGEQRLAKFRSQVTALATDPQVTPADFESAFVELLRDAPPLLRAARAAKARDLIDTLPSTHPDQGVNAAAQALKQHDTARSVLAVPGTEFVSASQVVSGPGRGFINRDLPGVVVIESQPYVPIYMTVFSDALTQAKPLHKDFGQDAAGRVQIHPGEGQATPETETTLWLSVGQPLRQLKWAEKYAAAPERPSPMIRSFLVPLGVANRISRRAVTEHESSLTTADLNVDKHFGANQFGIRDEESLELLRQFALPGSLRTYTDGAITGRPAIWGEVHALDELRTKSGVPVELFGDQPVFTGTDGNFLSPSRYATVTKKLREVIAAHTRNPHLLERGDTQLTSTAVRDFFRKNAPAHFGDVRDPGALDAFVDQLVIPWANQARIAEEIYAGFDELIAGDPSPTPANYRLTDATAGYRGQRRAEALRLGREHGDLLATRAEIRQGFQSLRGPVAEAFDYFKTPGLTADEAGRGQQAIREVGRLKDLVQRVHEDYAFKIGDHQALSVKIGGYASAAKNFQAGLNRVYAGVPVPPAVTAILDVLDRISGAVRESRPDRPWVNVSGLLEPATSTGTWGGAIRPRAGATADAGLEQQLDDLFGAAPSELPDCVVRAEAVARHLAGPDRPLGRASTTDDLTGPTARLSDLSELLGAGANGFHPLGSVDRELTALAEQLRGLPEGSVAYVATAAPNVPRHVVLLWRRADGPVWVELQAAGGERVRPLNDPPVMPVDARVVIKQADGTVIEPDLTRPAPPAAVAPTQIEPLTSVDTASSAQLEAIVAAAEQTSRQLFQARHELRTVRLTHEATPDVDGTAAGTAYRDAQQQVDDVSAGLDQLADARALSEQADAGILAAIGRAEALATALTDARARLRIAEEAVRAFGDRPEAKRMLTTAQTRIVDVEHRIEADRTAIGEHQQTLDRGVQLAQELAARAETAVAQTETAVRESLPLRARTLLGAGEPLSAQVTLATPPSGYQPLREALGTAVENTLTERNLAPEAIAVAVTAAQGTADTLGRLALGDVDRLLHELVNTGRLGQVEVPGSGLLRFRMRAELAPLDDTELPAGTRTTTDTLSHAEDAGASSSSSVSARVSPGLGLPIGAEPVARVSATLAMSASRSRSLTATLAEGRSTTTAVQAVPVRIGIVVEVLGGDTGRAELTGAVLDVPLLTPSGRVSAPLQRPIAASALESIAVAPELLTAVNSTDAAALLTRNVEADAGDWQAVGTIAGRQLAIQPEPRLTLLGWADSTGDRTWSTAGSKDQSRGSGVSAGVQASAGLNTTGSDWYVGAAAELSASGTGGNSVSLGADTARSAGVELLAYRVSRDVRVTGDGGRAVSTGAVSALTWVPVTEARRLGYPLPEHVNPWAEPLGRTDGGPGDYLIGTDQLLDVPGAAGTVTHLLALPDLSPAGRTEIEAAFTGDTAFRTVFDALHGGASISWTERHSVFGPAVTTELELRATAVPEAESDHRWPAAANSTTDGGSAGHTFSLSAGFKAQLGIGGEHAKPLGTLPAGAPGAPTSSSALPKLAVTGSWERTRKVGVGVSGADRRGSSRPGELHGHPATLRWSVVRRQFTVPSYLGRRLIGPDAATRLHETRPETRPDPGLEAAEMLQPLAFDVPNALYLGRPTGETKLEQAPEPQPDAGLHVRAATAPRIDNPVELADFAQYAAVEHVKVTPAMTEAVQIALAKSVAETTGTAPALRTSSLAGRVWTSWGRRVAVAADGQSYGYKLSRLTRPGTPSAKLIRAYLGQVGQRSATVLHLGGETARQEGLLDDGALTDLTGSLSVDATYSRPRVISYRRDGSLSRAQDGSSVMSTAIRTDRGIDAEGLIDLTPHRHGQDGGRIRAVLGGGHHRVSQSGQELGSGAGHTTTYTGPTVLIALDARYRYRGELEIGNRFFTKSSAGLPVIVDQPDAVLIRMPASAAIGLLERQGRPVPREIRALAAAHETAHEKARPEPATEARPQSLTAEYPVFGPQSLYRTVLNDSTAARVLADPSMAGSAGATGLAAITRETLTELGVRGEWRQRVVTRVGELLGSPRAIRQLHDAFGGAGADPLGAAVVEKIARNDVLRDDVIQIRITASRLPDRSGADPAKAGPVPDQLTVNPHLSTGRTASTSASTSARIGLTGDQLHTPVAPPLLDAADPNSGRAAYLSGTSTGFSPSIGWSSSRSSSRTDGEAGSSSVTYSDVRTEAGRIRFRVELSRIQLPSTLTNALTFSAARRLDGEQKPALALTVDAVAHQAGPSAEVAPALAARDDRKPTWSINPRPARPVTATAGDRRWGFGPADHWFVESMGSTTTGALRKTVYATLSDGWKALTRTFAHGPAEQAAQIEQAAAARSTVSTNGTQAEQTAFAFTSGSALWSGAASMFSSAHYAIGSVLRPSVVHHDLYSAAIEADLRGDLRFVSGASTVDLSRDAGTTVAQESSKTKGWTGFGAGLAGGLAQTLPVPNAGTGVSEGASNGFGFGRSRTTGGGATHGVTAAESVSGRSYLFDADADYHVGVTRWRSNWVPRALDALARRFGARPAELGSHQVTVGIDGDLRIRVWEETALRRGLITLHEAAATAGATPAEGLAGVKTVDGIGLHAAGQVPLAELDIVGGVRDGKVVHLGLGADVSLADVVGWIRSLPAELAPSGYRLYPGLSWDEAALRAAIDDATVPMSTRRMDTP
jgi:hypothetical protein